MNKQSHALVRKLIRYRNKFEKESVEISRACLKKLASLQLPGTKQLPEYASVLLFISAYPPDAEIRRLAENELSRITRHLKKNQVDENAAWVNSGLPYSTCVSSFSHDFTDYLYHDKELKLEISRLDHVSFSLNDVLKLTLSSLEKSETTADLDDDALFEALLVGKHERLTFILNELSKLNETPYVKDHLFDGLGLYTSVTSGKKEFSIFYNRLETDDVFYHGDLLKDFDYSRLIHNPAPPAEVLDDNSLLHAIQVVKRSMALTDRETDPVSYMDTHSFRLFHLARGISIAIYGMQAHRQLPLESYAGYTLFKNGFPAAYGGCWVFGECANFGINIFEPFRGGESGYMMCQLLHLYKQLFGISYFEVEPYQFGLDNPEGIESGAFWFYYRYGFRPSVSSLKKLAADEYRKITLKKNYQTSAKVLLEFTKSNLALQLGKKIPVKVADITNRVIRLIQQEYHGNRKAGLEDAIRYLKSLTTVPAIRNTAEKQVLEEVAWWARAFQIGEKSKLELLVKMFRTKPVDLYGYQKLLLEFFTS